jgi:hypothetical protein
MSPADPAGPESAAAPSGAEVSGAAATSGAAPATVEWYRHFGTVDAPGNSACGSGLYRRRGP